MTLKHKLSGKFIVFDGPDGSGKGTQIERLARALTAEGVPIVCTRDPGGTAIGDQIREILLHKNLLAEMDVRCETLLFMASRAQLVGEVIAPAIREGKTVICDRFISATCAYQGAAGYDVAKIIELGRFAVGDLWPQLTLVLDVPADEGLKRAGRRQEQAVGARHDAMEARPIDFHRRVRDIFLQLPGVYPGRVEVVNGGGSPDDVHGRVMEVLKRVAF
ncbi:MAG: dTMP kinase [Planctomycetes bacterium]|nr:dTMP kinase [Planctomycetota bacterium]